MVGQTLGKYEILQRLAAGGMAEIFLARMVGVLGFDKLVVIKRILPHLSQRNDFIQMFLDEARIATTLVHANIVQTHEVGVHGKSYFMVMEYLPGEDVRSIVRRIGKSDGRLPIDHALNIARGVAAGLQYAHEQRDRDGRSLDIVHRDVTPQNVIVTYDGAVKLLDFGIAKASNRINETRSGSFKGKVPYMSPEQCRGEALDRRSDIFSLGIMLHEMTLCRRLFRGDTDFQILKQIAEGPIVKPCDIDPAYDARLQAIVMKALERDPRRRFQTARELEEALEELAHDMRLRLSPLSLADYMRALFADQVGAWQSASADGDLGKLERHFATVMAEREADLSSEEAQPNPERQQYPEPQSEAQLSSLPNDDIQPRRRPARLWMVTLGFVATAAALVAWRAREPATAATAASAAKVQPSAAAPAQELPNPELRREEPPSVATPGAPAAAAEPAAAPVPSMAATAMAATATLEVSTTPSGAILVLDGKTLPQKSPARLAVAAGQPHTLMVRASGRAGVAQRFMLDAGEEAGMEIDLRRSAHASVRRSTPAVRPLHPQAAPAAPGTSPASSASSASGTALPPAKRDGEGTLVIASSPWCNVSVDGQPRGTTPLNLKLKAGAHEIVLANPEFKIKRSLAIDIEPNQTVRKSLDFAPE
ncbi:MAG: Protein kinase [Myxococcales bacterium]|nr:Protein kinase [Myxococcales bacterium]